jgi:dienelactone hydrolase
MKWKVISNVYLNLRKGNRPTGMQMFIPTSQRTENMKFYVQRIYCSILLFVFSTACVAQSCDAITRESISNPGPYNVETMVESDGLRDGPDYAGATVYYPANGSPPFTSIVIVPGYYAPESMIRAWGPFLASHGIVTMTIGTNLPGDTPSIRASALLDAVETLRQENTRPGSPLFGNIDTGKFAASGWSMGGGGAQFAAARDQGLKAVVALCPWLHNSVTSADLNHPVPLLILSGEMDESAPPTEHADIHYDLTPTATEKLLFEVANGDHRVANGPEGGQGDVGIVALSWLKTYLVGDDCYRSFLLETPATASRYVTNVEMEPFQINAGLNDAWYYPDTDGQGFFITVLPDLGTVSLAWFTYDTELPDIDAFANLGDAGHRWLTALGPIDGNRAVMNIEFATGGIFDTFTEIQRTDPEGSDGTITLTFDSCNSGTVEYDIPSIDRQGIVPIQRVANDNVVLCEALKAD